jgi:spermidine synthase
MSNYNKYLENNETSHKGGSLLHQQGDELYTSLFLGVYFSSFNIKTKELSFWYCRKICEVIVEDIKRKNNPNKKYNILLLGLDLGGILIHLTNKYDNIFVTGVDIFDTYFDIIKKYSPPNYFKLIKEDANEFMKNTIDTYDYIICDIFTHNTLIPDFVFSNEFIINIKKHLNADGLFLINTVSISYAFLKMVYTKIFNNSKITFENEIPFILNIFVFYTSNTITIINNR